METELLPSVNRILEIVQRPFWVQPGFWVSLLVGIGGLGFSYAAFDEAKKAKRAATEAGRTVKIQTIAIELTEIAQKLDRMQPEIEFSEARDLLAEVSRRLRRAISPFSEDIELGPAITATRGALEQAHKSLKSVRPTDPNKESEAPNAVYYGIEDDFATLNGCLADLLGLFEKQTFDFGEDDVYR